MAGSPGRNSRALERALEQFRGSQTAELQKAMRALAGTEQARARALVAFRLTRSTQFQKTVRQVARLAQRQLDAAFPSNWTGFDREQVDAAIALAEGAGINTVWVPRREILLQLIDASSEDERDAVLVGRQAEVVADLGACLLAVDSRELATEVRLASRALRALKEGHAEAAHALAASILSGVVRDRFGHVRFNRAREQFTREHPNEAALQLLRLTTILQAFGRSLHHTDHAPGPGFNRHATAHGHLDQYTDVNAVAALLLLVGLLRELPSWLRESSEAGNEAPRP